VTETVLVTDGTQRAALALTRAYGRAGHRVLVTAERVPSLAGVSRFAAWQGLVPDPLAAPAEFVARLRQIIAEQAATVLVPVTEPALLAILGAPEAFAGCRVLAPPLERFLAVSDKARLLEAATGLGIAVPSQTVVPSIAAALEAITAAKHFPLVLKPARSVSGSGAGRVKLGVRYARNRVELALELGGIPAAAFPVLLQQRIVGPGIGVFLLRWRGKTLGRFFHRRLREKPPSGGVSVYAESIAPDEALQRQSEALLDQLGWYGVAMVEYKRDAATGTPYLMEINGRFWGSLQLAIDAGVDFPNLLLAAKLGQVVEPVVDYRIGIRWRWWWGCVDHLLARLRHSDAALALPPGELTRWGAVASLLPPWRRGEFSETFRRDDPRPFLRETLDWILRR